MIILSRIIHWIFFTYTILLFVRVVGSWFPSFRRLTLARFVCFYTDPYLNLFRRIIPPIGGALDLSPILGFFLLQLSEKTLLWLLGRIA
jgi:YggT family protein